MNDKKAWWESTTILSGGVIILATVANAFGFSMTDADQQQLVDLAYQIIVGVAGLSAIYGRVKASKRIG